MYVWVHVSMWRSEDNLWELILSVYQMGIELRLWKAPLSTELAHQS